MVDQTYKTDGGVSAKGCVDPASAWRTIAADTFVFVADWPKLPATLIENDALDVEKRAARVARLHGVLRRVADDARDAILTPPKNAKTVCATVPLFDDELQQLVQQAYDYYTQPAPAGAPYGGMPWFDAFVDNPALPTNTCGSKDLSAANGAKWRRRGVRAAERRLLRLQGCGYNCVIFRDYSASACAGGTSPPPPPLFEVIRPPG